MNTVGGLKQQPTTSILTSASTLVIRHLWSENFVGLTDHTDTLVFFWNALVESLHWSAKLLFSLYISDIDEVMMATSDHCILGGHCVHKLLLSYLYWIFQAICCFLFCVLAAIRFISLPHRQVKTILPQFGLSYLTFPRSFKVQLFELVHCLNSCKSSQEKYAISGLSPVNVWCSGPMWYGLNGQDIQKTTRNYGPHIMSQEQMRKS